MSHNIASISQAAFLPQRADPGISAVQSQPSFGFEENDAFERKESLEDLSKTRKSPAPAKRTTNPLYRLILMVRRLLWAILSPIRRVLLS